MVPATAFISASLLGLLHAIAITSDPLILFQAFNSSSIELLMPDRVVSFSLVCDHSTVRRNDDLVSFLE